MWNSRKLPSHLIWSPPAPRVYHIHGPQASWLSAFPRHKELRVTCSKTLTYIIGKFIFSQCRHDMTPRNRLRLERKSQKVGPHFHLHLRGGAWQRILGSGCFGVQFLFGIADLISGGDSHTLRGCRGARGRKLSLQDGVSGGYRNQRVAVWSPGVVQTKIIMLWCSTGPRHREDLAKVVSWAPSFQHPSFLDLRKSQMSRRKWCQVGNK